MDKCKRAAFMGDLQKYSICTVRTFGHSFILQKCKRKQRSIFPVYVADHCVKLWILYSGGTLGSYNSAYRNVDDSVDLFIFIDGCDRLSVYEKAG